MKRRKKKQRLDELVVARGLAPDLAAARAEIMADNILVEERGDHKPGQLVPDTAVLRRRREPEPYVGRGGRKLAGALAAAAVDVAGCRALDAGASTGGFTDCLLQHGAAAVTAVDVGRGLLAHRLRIDPRVTVIENCNIRAVRADELGGPFDLVVADLSFISLRTVLPALAEQARPGGRLLLLVKPQFEAPRELVGPGGVVGDEAARRRAIDAVSASARDCGLLVEQSLPSCITGAQGNREYFLLCRRPA